MKIKLMIALAVMALVLGMVLIACDDGDLPTITVKDDGTEVIFDMELIPYLDKDGNLKNGGKDTTKYESPLPSDEDDDGDEEEGEEG